MCLWFSIYNLPASIDQSYRLMSFFLSLFSFSFPSLPGVGGTESEVGWAISSSHEHPCLGSVASYHPANRLAYCGKWLEVMSFFTLKSRARGPLEAHKSWEGPCSRSTSNLIKQLPILMVHEPSMLSVGEAMPLRQSGWFDLIRGSLGSLL